MIVDQLVNVVCAFVARIMAVIAIAFVLFLLAAFALCVRVIWVLTS
jgi:hypothetical protein